MMARRSDPASKRGKVRGLFNNLASGYDPRFAAGPGSFIMSPMNTETITPTTAREREAAAANAVEKPVRDHTLALTLSYNGAPFSGFARQPGQTTVQGDLEDALRLLFRRDIETTCAGRTDAGVHALGQVVSFDVNDLDIAGRSLPSLRRSLNALTHDAVVDRQPPWTQLSALRQRFETNSRGRSLRTASAVVQALMK